MYQDHECIYTSSEGDRPMYQIRYANVKANRSYGSDTKTRQKPLNLTFRSKVNVESGSLNVCDTSSHVIDACDKYDKPMSYKKKTDTCMGRTRKHVQKLSKFDLEVKVILGLKMSATHHLIEIHPCAKYGKQMSNHKQGVGRTRIHVKNPIYLP